jgi:hypothetical protein
LFGISGLFQHNPPIAIIDASLQLKNAFCAKTGADQGAQIEAKSNAALQEQRELLVA